MLKTRIAKIALVICSSFPSGLVFAGDISGFNQLPFQWQNEVTGASFDHDHNQFHLGLHEAENIQLKPIEKQTLGRFSQRSFGFQLPIDENWQFGFTSSLITSQIKKDPDQMIPKTTAGTGITLALALHRKLLDFDIFKLAILGSLEPATYSKKSFALPSKSRLGLTLIPEVSWENWTLAFNISGRYRPAELYGMYKLSHDYINSARLSFSWQQIDLHAAFVERNFFVMNSIRRHPEFQNQVGRYHRIGAGLDLDAVKLSTTFSKALDAKTFGIPEKTWELNVAFRIGKTKDAIEVKDDFIPVDESTKDPQENSTEEEATPNIDEGTQEKIDTETNATSEDAESVLPQSEDNQEIKPENNPPRIDAPQPEEVIETPESLRKELEETKAEQSQVGSEMDSFYLLEEGPSQYKSKSKRIEDEYLEAEMELQRLDRVNQILLKNQNGPLGAGQP